MRLCTFVSWGVWPCGGKDTVYRLDPIITSSNANPEEISLLLNWDGGHEDASLQEAITVIK